MGLEKVIHRMAKDVAFAESLQRDARLVLEREGYRLSSEELEGLQSVLSKVEITDRVQIGDKPMFDWYETKISVQISRKPMFDWYASQSRTYVGIKPMFD